MTRWQADNVTRRRASERSHWQKRQHLHDSMQGLKFFQEALDQTDWYARSASWKIDDQDIYSPELVDR